MTRCILFVLAIHWSTIAVAEPVVVHAQSGRKFKGEVDLRTSADVLVLRSGKPQTFVRRPINWDRVKQVVVGEKTLSGAEFRRLVQSPEWQMAVDPFADDTPAPRPTEPANSGSVIQAAAWEPEREPPAIPRVAALHIDTYLANWDSDVEEDGLVIHVYPLDQTGATIPALGTLDVDLTGQGGTNLVAGDPFPQLGRWTQIVRPEDMGSNGAVYRLPFQSVHPDFSANARRLGSIGMLHARLSVAGQGVFEDTAAFTRIRPYSPVRDRLQQYRGTRYLPQELTGAR